MTCRVLEEPLRLFRVADVRFDPMSGHGAMVYAGRWNLKGTPVVYTGLAYEGCLLEILVHLDKRLLPSTQACVVVTIPAGVRVCEYEPGDVEAWTTNATGTQQYGDDWAASGSSAVLLVPGLVARPHQVNAVINPRHQDFALVESTKPELVEWDARLF